MKNIQEISKNCFNCKYLLWATSYDYRWCPKYTENGFLDCWELNPEADPKNIQEWWERYLEETNKIPE